MIQLNEKKAMFQHSVLFVTKDFRETEGFNYWFRNNGFSVDVVTSAMDGISQARIKNYFLILIDLDMDSDLGGFETLWLLKTLVSSSKIVLLGSVITQEQINRAASYGISKILQKPFDPTHSLLELDELIQFQGQSNRSGTPSWRKTLQMVRDLIKHGNEKG